jgi:hypothetical protein
VLVRVPGLRIECPAIVTRARASEDGTTHVNVWAFPDFQAEQSDTRPFIDLAPQSESSEGWGWRWPPRESVTNTVRESEASEPPSESQEEPLSRV